MGCPRTSVTGVPKTLRNTGVFGLAVWVGTVWVWVWVLGSVLSGLAGAGVLTPGKAPTDPIGGGGRIGGRDGVWTGGGEGLVGGIANGLCCWACAPVSAEAK